MLESGVSGCGETSVGSDPLRNTVPANFKPGASSDKVPTDVDHLKVTENIKLNIKLKVSKS